MSINIYIFTFSKRVYKVANRYVSKHCVFTPLEVGAECRSNANQPIYNSRDDIGENISSENPYYGELTGMYWVWKNALSEFVGFYHYNKYLCFYEESIKGLLDGKYDFVVENRLKCVPHYIHNEYRIFRDTLEKYDKAFFRIYEGIFDEEGSGKCSMQNMFVTTWKCFDDYCRFLFPLLTAVRERIGDGDRLCYHKRYNAFFAERLLTPFLIYRGYTFKEVDVDWYPNKRRKLTVGLINKFRRFIPSFMDARIDRYLNTSSYR